MAQNKRRRRKGSSPRLQLELTPKQIEAAVQSDSGACLIADAIKREYPHLTGVRVDMATIRLTDKAAGERYTYLTPDTAQLALLYFDQGWPMQPSTVRLERAVKIDAITRSTPRTKAREVRLAELEGREERGEELTRNERVALAKLRNNASRPPSAGEAEIVGDAVVGGQPLTQGGKGHPGLLRNRRRIYGAKLAQPGEVFQRAVEEAVAQRGKA